MDKTFKYGLYQPVQKRSGYKFPGAVVARFYTLGDKKRYVVECTLEGARGCLHIYAEEQLKGRRIDRSHAKS